MSPRVGSCTETCFSTVVAGAVTADDGNRSSTQFADIVYGKRRFRGIDERRLWTDDMDSC